MREPEREFCPTHKEVNTLACGCHTSVLITKSAFWEQLQAKDKWINELLKEIEELRGMKSDEDLL